VPPLASRAAVEARVAVLRAAGVMDPVVVDTGPQRFAIALGVFRTEEAANAHLAELTAKGVNNARVGQPQQPIALTTLVIRDPRDPVMNRLRELAPAYPGREAKVGACEQLE
jgi:hypothetical protein